ncbi:hypothetical protein [Paraburkholderia atlantica]|uniref:hypothetical protein n=1 Tax=Paraburkholderia atlantica TaxID=2654982 RepID=UPI00162221E1|nr:hypothetical protein [Paraburkholderia atlantica]MBB5508157.1 hypothetical protein [Paraburkholderia atlantica]
MPQNEELSDDMLVDPEGRRLKVKKLDFLAESRVMRLLGDASTNQGYVMGYVFPAVSVREIDGEAFAVPSTQKELDAAIIRLGEKAAPLVLQKLLGVTPDDEVDAVKN